jgi:fluoride ion exporter CrcB/FEX
MSPVGQRGPSVVETYRYTQQGAYALAALNVGLTLVVCFVAGAAGDVVARVLVRS